MQTNDAALMLACQAGDEDAFGELVERHLDAVHCFLARRCPRWSVVEDAAQETFVRAWQRRASFTGDSAPRSWLLGIARNVLHEYGRREGRHLQLVDNLLYQEETAEASVVEAALDGYHDRLAAMRHCLAELDERARRLLLARHRDGRSLQELARAYQRKAATIPRRIHRLTVQVRGCMERRLS